MFENRIGQVFESVFRIFAIFKFNDSNRLVGRQKTSSHHPIVRKKLRKFFAFSFKRNVFHKNNSIASFATFSVLLQKLQINSFQSLKCGEVLEYLEKTASPLFHLWFLFRQERLSQPYCPNPKTVFHSFLNISIRKWKVLPLSKKISGKLKPKLCSDSKTKSSNFPNLEAF